MGTTDPIRINVAKVAIVPRWVIQLEGMRGNSGRIATYVALRAVEYANPDVTWSSERELAVALSEVAGIGPEAVRKHIRAMRTMEVLTGAAGELKLPLDEPASLGTTIPSDLSTGDCGPQTGDPGPHAPLSSIGKETDSDPKARKTKRSSFPEQWEPGEAEREAATKVGMNATQRRDAWAQFRHHHEAKGSTMANWSAAWRYWCGNWRGFTLGAPAPVALSAHHGDPFYDGSDNWVQRRENGTLEVLKTFEQVYAERDAEERS